MMRVWVLDDEPLAVRRLARMIEETGRAEIAGRSSDPEETLEGLSEERVDGLFLDIEMPGLNGFDLLARLDRKPAVVFTTAYDRYAVKAFEANGADYLLKPVSSEALGRALDRIEQRRSADPEQYDEMSEVCARLSKKLRPDRSAVIRRVSLRGWGIACSSSISIR